MKKEKMKSDDETKSVSLMSVTEHAAGVQNQTFTFSFCKGLKIIEFISKSHNKQEQRDK